MKFAAHLGVLDEVELILPAIEHLYRIGVDHVIVFDMGSKDGTLETVERLCGSNLDLVRLANDTSWEEFSRRMVESVRRVPVDWVLFLDADEFWLPATGSLRDCAAVAENDIVTVDRFNVVVTASGPAIPLPPVPAVYPHIHLYTRPMENVQEDLELHPDTPWISRVPVPKVIGRLGFIESVSMGAHDITTADERPARRARATDLVIAHVPFSSLERFRRRLANIGEFLRLNPNYLRGAQGWHWKRFHEISLQGGIEDEYRRQLIEQPRHESLAARGTVRTAAQLLHG